MNVLAVVPLFYVQEQNVKYYLEGYDDLDSYTIVASHLCLIVKHPHLNNEEGEEK